MTRKCPICRLSMNPQSFGRDPYLHGKNRIGGFCGKGPGACRKNERLARILLRDEQVENQWLASTLLGLFGLGSVAVGAFRALSMDS